MKCYHVISFFLLLFLTGIPACKNYLDVPPMNVVQDKDLFANEEAMTIYMARLYSQMPFEEFKYSPARGFFDDWLVTPGANEGSSIGRDAGQAMTSEAFSRGKKYWVRAYELLRDANRMIETLPSFKSNFSADKYKHFIGEGYFARAVVFYALAKRYGGVPLVTNVLQYDPANSASKLEVRRSTEEETWNRVLADFDTATFYLSAASPKRGYANKYVSLAFKSEAMLFAGSVAKYNTLTGFGAKTGVRVIGFDPATAGNASKKYFLEAYKAGRTIMTSGTYSLYKKKWSATDKDGQYQNMVDMFSDISSPENIYVKEYKYPDLSHGYDAYNIPRQLMGGNGYSAGNCPTLDFVELFDGFDKNPDGTIKVLNADNKYLLFDKVTDLFANCEPRLRANVILPGDIFKGESIEIRRGVYTGSAANGIAPLRAVNGNTDYSLAGPSNYNQVDAYKKAGSFTAKSLYLSSNGTTHETVKLENGTVINGGGKNGPFTDDNTCAMTGFTVRKWLNPNLSQSLVLEARSDQPFVLMRYGEILLNVAEAAAELLQAGASSPTGDDFLNVAYNAVKDIRERAGAAPLMGASDLAGGTGLQLIRKERRKELAFENKILWDIRRWRTQHSDRLNGFTQSDGAYYKGLYPFYSTATGKYFFDAGFDERRWRFRFTYQDYYFEIPGEEVSKSPMIDQQPGR